MNSVQNISNSNYSGFIQNSQAATGVQNSTEPCYGGVAAYSQPHYVSVTSAWRLSIKKLESGWIVTYESKEYAFDDATKLAEFVKEKL